MASRIDTILKRIDALQEELEEAISARREEFRYRIERGKVRFEAEALLRQRAFRIRLRDFLARTRPLTVITAPVIYGLIVPFVFMDLCVSLYQAICFRAYGIPRVRRGDHIRIDRHHLAYLNGLQKLNCVYCGYCNGVASFVREVASRTEAYWCPIKHASRMPHAHERYAEFLDFGDAEAFQEGLQASRHRVSRSDKP